MIAPRLHIDAETTSTEDLRKTGAERYMQHKNTQVTVVCWAIDNGPVSAWYPGQPCPQEIIDHILNDHILVAHNYQFELALFWYILGHRHNWPVPTHDQWSCTMARAQYHGLPAGLFDLGVALGLSVLKDKFAHGLMMRMARPRSIIPLVWWHETDPVKLSLLTDYCITDVKTEREADRILPELPPRERNVWLMDGRINRRGVRIDVEAVEVLTTITQAEQGRLGGAMAIVTHNRVKSVSHTGALLRWVQGQGLPVQDLTRDTVQGLLAHPNLLAPYRGVQQALECRREGNRTSSAKFRSMLAAIGIDHRARGLFAYYGAGRTGRFSSKRVQFQNLLRPTIQDPTSALELILTLSRQGLHGDEIANALYVLYPDTPLGVVVSCLRGCIVADLGNVLTVADLAQIEARVICWLSGQRDVLQVFARGDDVYAYTAGQQGSSDRQFGKVLVLACGFGMGPPKFQATAAKYGIVLNDDQAWDAVHGWRANNPYTVAFWYELGDAALALTRARTGTTKWVRDIKFARRARSIRITLPSGRDLIYQSPQIIADPRMPNRPQFSYLGVDSYTRQYKRLRSYGGKLAENITQALARDVMVEAALTLESGPHSVPVLGHSHDELIGQAPEARAQTQLKLMLDVMKITPAWAPGLPVGAEGFTSYRYRK